MKYGENLRASTIQNLLISWVCNYSIFLFDLLASSNMQDVQVGRMWLSPLWCTQEVNEESVLRNPSRRPSPQRHPSPRYPPQRNHQEISSSGRSFSRFPPQRNHQEISSSGRSFSRWPTQVCASESFRRPESAPITYVPRENVVHFVDDADTGVSVCHEKSLRSVLGNSILGTTRFQTSTPPTSRSSFSRRSNYKRSSSRHRRRKSKIFRNPDHLGSISLYYCSTPGLIDAGVLQKPKNWEKIRQDHNSRGLERNDDWKALSDAKVQKIIIRRDHINSSGTTEARSEEVEFFDISQE